jgi:hypothetical protein
MLIEYVPSAPLAAVVALPVAAVNARFAPGTMAPDSSVTTPRSVALWANNVAEKTIRSGIRNTDFILDARSLEEHAAHPKHAMATFEFADF